MNIIKTLFSYTKLSKLPDLALLLLRVSMGLMMAFSHGLGKIQKLIDGGEIKFADPIGIGVYPLYS